MVLSGKGWKHFYHIMLIEILSGKTAKLLTNIDWKQIKSVTDTLVFINLKYVTLSLTVSLSQQFSIFFFSRILSSMVFTSCDVISSFQEVCLGSATLFLLSVVTQSQWTIRGRQFVTTDSCPKNWTAAPGKKCQHCFSMLRPKLLWLSCGPLTAHQSAAARQLRIIALIEVTGEIDIVHSYWEDFNLFLLRHFLEGKMYGTLYLSSGTE